VHARWNGLRKRQSQKRIQLRCKPAKISSWRALPLFIWTALHQELSSASAEEKDFALCPVIPGSRRQPF